jgi:hypothetical protein
MAKAIALSSILLIIVAALGCSDDVPPPNATVDMPPRPEVPFGLTAAIGDGQVRLAWSANNPAVIQRYRLYFSDLGPNTVELFDSTTAMEYTATNLANGVPYYFAVTAIDTSGLESKKSQVIAVAADVFSIVLEDGDLYTNSLGISVDMTAPTGTGRVELTEDTLTAGGDWRAFTTSQNFTLNVGPDGVRTVFARFLLDGGRTSNGWVRDTIILDRSAEIDSIIVTPESDPLLIGDLVHFALYTTETGGEASVSINSLPVLALNDEGRKGDAVADDGIYELDFEILATHSLWNADVTGSFTDAAGNDADPLTAEDRLSTSNPLNLRAFSSSSSQIILDWKEPGVTEFLRYALFRSVFPNVMESDTLVTVVTSSSTTTFTDSNLEDSRAYFYKLYLYNRDGEKTSSQEVSTTTLGNDPPTEVFLTAVKTDTTSVRLTWTENEDDDFKSYRIVRADATPVSYSDDNVVGVVNIRGTTTQTNEVPSATATYYYRVFVFDKQGASTGSNTVTVN